MRYYRDNSASTTLDTPAEDFSGELSNKQRIDMLLAAQQSLLRVIEDQRAEIYALKEHIGQMMFRQPPPTEH
jgi:hypothetical protein